MVDLHSHVLYGMDDGARTLETSLEMVRMAAACGTTDLVCSPHNNHEYTYDPALIDARIAELQSRADCQIRIHRGCDLHLSYNNVRDACNDPKKYAINGTSYVLVEFADYLHLPSGYAMLAELQRAGMLPIITHPERNPVLSQELDVLATWVDRECFLQITALSVVGGFGMKAQRCCEDLIRRGLVHFVSSDAHDTVHRPPRLDQAKEWLSEKFGAEYAELLVKANPAAVLADQPLLPGPQKPAVPPKRWYQFW